MASGSGHELRLFLANHRMEDLLESLQGIWPAKNGLSQCGTIDRAMSHRTRKGSADRPHGTPTSPLHAMHGGIGVEYGDMGAAESCCRRRFAHADPSRQTENLHRMGRSATMKRRSSSSTVGSTPNHAWNPGTAWCSSMPRPSTVLRPCARPADNSGVASGT